MENNTQEIRFNIEKSFVVLTEAIKDLPESFEFKLLYLTDDSSRLYFIDTKGKTETTKINFKEYDLENINNVLSDNSNAYKVMEIWIKSKLTANGDYAESDKETKYIIENLIKNVHFLGTEEKDSYRLDIIEKETNEDILRDIQVYSDISIKREFTKKEDKIKHNLEHRKNIGKTRQDLGDYLNKKGIILRENTHHVYYLDKKSNGYTSVTNDKIIIALSKIFGKNIICDDDVETALSFISERLTPTYNIIKLGNCLYSMEKHEIIKSTEPIFTLIETKYNYNPKAESKYLKEFLYSSLARLNDDGTENKEETEKAVTGFMQLVGYCFVSGNPSTILPFITGVSGGGKSLAGNIITAIFGTAKIGDAKLQDLSTGGFSTSQLVNKVINIVRDSDDKPIENNGLLKQISGYEDLAVEEKYKNPYTLPKEEVPTMLVVCNNAPIFKNIEEAIIERMGFIEFLVKFRGTDKEDKTLEKKIISNNEELEWLIYHSLEAYKEMVEYGKDFNFRVDRETTLEIFNKHSNPLGYLIRKLILKHDPEAYENETNNINFNSDNKSPYIPTNELNELCVFLAKKEGIEITVNKNGKIAPRKLINAIRREFDLLDYINKKGDSYTTISEYINKKSERVYPELIKTKVYNKILSELNEAKENKE